MRIHLFKYSLIFSHNCVIAVENCYMLISETFLFNGSLAKEIPEIPCKCAALLGPLLLDGIPVTKVPIVGFLLLLCSRLQ